MDRYEIVSDAAYACGETPMWDAERQELWWSDMLGACLYKYAPRDGSITEWARGKNVSGFTMNKSGGLVCATHQGLFLWDETNGYRLIAAEHEGHKLGCNDATADARGRFLFGTTFYNPDSSTGEYPLGKLFSVGNDGALAVLDENVHLSNGIGFSPDNRTMYFTDTVLRRIYAYDYDLETGGVSGKRTFVQVPEDEGIPDGLTVDAEGFVWSAQWYGSRIVRYSPDGAVDRVVFTPAKQTSSVVFGGAHLTDLYVTSAALSVTLACAPSGYDFGAPFVGGPLYRYDFGIKGIAEHVADIRL